MPDICRIASAPDALGLRLANTQDDIEAVQRLRWQVFHDEMGARGASFDRAGVDRDAHDAVCDHLLVMDGYAVVGTYRLLRQSVAERHGGFYSAGEYDLAPLLRHGGGSLLELGRSCVLPPYRTSAVIALLWRGIADYLARHEIGLMFGCASFPGTDVEAHAPALSYLHHHHLAQAELRPVALPEHYQAMELCGIGTYDRRAAMQALPPLIKGYLRVGATIGDGAFIDRQFNTVDVCVVMPVEKIAQRYAARFSAAA